MSDLTPRDRRPETIVAAWWRGLQPRSDGSGGNRAALARLRRSHTALEASSEEETLKLCRALGRGWKGLEGAAVAAAVLAHVREDAPGERAARQLGATPSIPAVMSWLRFRRLAQAGTPDEQVIAFRRAVALAGGRLNVADLGASLLDWNDTRRRRWMYDYHDAPIGDAKDNVA